MKTRQSGMPDEGMWHTFFDPPQVLLTLGLHSEMIDVADSGCGYGTFTIPAGLIAKGSVHAFDIEEDMIAATREKAKRFNLSNIRLYRRDFVTEGTGLPEASVDYAMLFNILHAENPEILLSEALRILQHGGILGIMHWNHDPDTPRGPPMDIRPKSELCVRWAEEAGFLIIEHFVALPPYHYGIIAKKGQIR